MKTRILARQHWANEWISIAYQRDGSFAKTQDPSKTVALEKLETEVQKIIFTQSQTWFAIHAQPSGDTLNCPEGAIKLPIDLWVCKLTKDICPIQAQVFLNDRERFFRHCLAPSNRKEQIFETAHSGSYDGFHHVVGRYLCPACEKEGKKLSFRHHYPWELTSIEAYYDFEYERDWPTFRKKLKDKSFGLTLIGNALCAPHCKQFATEFDASLADELTIIEFEISR